MLNSKALNSLGVNETGNAVGEGLFFGVAQSVELAPEFGLIIGLPQLVGAIGADSLLEIEQTVNYVERGAGLIISLEQQIGAIGSTSLLTIEQRVLNSAIPSHLERNGWDAIITIDGNIIDSSHIHGQIKIERSEQNAALAEFTLIPDLGFQSPVYYSGKSVTIDVQTQSGTRRIYTGVIDVPEIDLIEKKITLNCTDRREELIKNQLVTVVNSVGYFSPIIFQTSKDIADNLSNRLSTVPQSLDFDQYGNYHITSWFAKASPDYVLEDSDIYYSTPRVELSSRARILNKVSIGFQYRYERLFHTERDFTWRSPIADNINTLLQYGYSLTYRKSIIDAITASEWPVKGDVSFTPIWPSGWYGGRAWSTVSHTYTSVPTLDSNGDVVKDANGNPVTTNDIRGGTDYGPLYCMGAGWTGTFRWSQTVTENLTLNVQSSQSIAQYGIIDDTETYSYETELNSTNWENYKSYNDTGHGSGNYYINADTTRSQLNSAIYTAVNKARTSILASHRDNRVIFNKFLWPEIDLRHTVEIDTDILQTKGKVFGIQHIMDISTGEARTEIELAIFKAQGVGTNSAIAIPTFPADSASPGNSVITLGNHFGEDPTTEAAQLWNGMIGNRYPLGGLARTDYIEQFIVDTPAIPDMLRNEKNLYATTSYDMVIPDDDLTIIF